MVNYRSRSAAVAPSYSPPGYFTIVLHSSRKNPLVGPVRALELLSVSDYIAIVAFQSHRDFSGTFSFDVSTEPV